MKVVKYERNIIYKNLPVTDRNCAVRTPSLSSILNLAVVAEIFSVLGKSKCRFIPNIHWISEKSSTTRHQPN